MNYQNLDLFANMFPVVTEIGSSGLYAKCPLDYSYNSNTGILSINNITKDTPNPQWIRIYYYE